MPLAELDLTAWRARFTGTFQDFLPPQPLTRAAVGAGDLPRVKDAVAVTHAVARAAAELSHGQWQRLAFARGRMRDSPLLGILDEPTAALDPQAEHDLYDRYAERAQASRDRLGAITLLVSHRFSTGPGRRPHRGARRRQGSGDRCP